MKALISSLLSNKAPGKRRISRLYNSIPVISLKRFTLIARICHALIKNGLIILILVMLFTTQLFYIFQVLFFFLRFLIVSCLYRLSCVCDQALFFEAATFLHNPG